ncbi:hypothetical protein FRC18_008189 [Serendipita sp. 400]|nr:hypothetical protein FRC18_008189 [Serendipita sp. 400]
MISSSLVAFVPFVLTANALLFEPPFATVSKRNIAHHRRVADAVDRRGHIRRASRDQRVSTPFISLLLKSSLLSPDKRACPLNFRLHGHKYY